MQYLSILAFRNLRVRPVRTLLTAGGIILGVAVILAISITNASTLASLDAFFTDITGAAHLAIESAEGHEDSEGFHQRILERVRGVQGVALAVPGLGSDGVLLLEDQEVNLTVFGIDPVLDPQIRSYHVLEGRFLEEDEYAVVVVEDLAKWYDIEAGQELQILTTEGPEFFPVVGILANEGPARLAKMAIPLEVAQRVFARGHNIDAVHIVAEPEIAETAPALDRLKATLQEILGEEYEVFYPAARSRQIAEMLEGLQMGLGFFSVIALFVGAYLIFNTFSMTVVERTREIGLLRAVGTTRGQTFRLLLTEALVLGFAGSGLGVLCGIILAIPLMRMMNSMLGGLPLNVFTLPTGGLATSLIAGLVVTLVSALLPAIQAGRIACVEALTVRARVREGWLVRRGWPVGLILAFVGLAASYLPLRHEVEEMVSYVSLFAFLVGVTLLVPASIGLLERLSRRVLVAVYGNEGMLGSSNLQRAKGRTSLTVGALMVGVLMTVAIGTMSTTFTTDARKWLDKAMGADMFIHSEGEIRFELRRELEAVEGVEMVTPIGWKRSRLVGSMSRGVFTARDEPLDIKFFEPPSYAQVAGFQFASGQGKDEAAMIERLAQGDAVFLSTVLAQEYGLGKGDTVRLRTARGERDFEIAGVVIEYSQAGHVLIGSWVDLERYFGENKAHLLLAKVAPGASIADVGARIEEQFGELTTESGEEARERWLQKMRQWLSMFNVLVLIGIIVAGLGVINTLTMSVLERMREIGCLRAIGMTRWQVVKMVLAEAGAMGAIGGLFGIGFGALLSRDFVQGMMDATGWESTYIFPTSSLGIGLVLALVVSQLAALYPAWRAARLQPVEALRYE